ncbi:MAG TPA: alpha/beta hydrolase, partial [Pirellulaceae bacterium]
HGMLGALQKVTRLGPLGRWTFRQLIRFLQRYRGGFEFLHRWNVEDQAAYHHSACGRQALAAIYHDFRRYHPETLGQFFDQLRGFDISPRLGAIQCPTTIVGGTCDPIIPFSHTQHIAQMIPHSRLIAWDRCGHIFFSERTHEFQRLLLDWLSEQNRHSRLCAVT